MSGVADGLLLAVDTATRSSLVVLGGAAVLASSRRDVNHRHGSHLLEQIDEVLHDAGASLDAVSALAVGTGPGSFTGLRVGLATMKTLAYARHVPLVAVMSSDALRRAAVAAGASAGTAVVLPAGAHDHYLARFVGDPVLVAPGDLVAVVAGGLVLTVDMEAALLGEAAADLGRRAVEGMPAASLALARERLASGLFADISALIPAYVALPRGVARAAEDLGWSPDLR